MISPIGREVDRGGGTTGMTGQRQGQQQQQQQQQQRVRADCGELLQKRVSERESRLRRFNAKERVEFDWHGRA